MKKIDLSESLRKLVKGTKCSKMDFYVVYNISQLHINEIQKLKTCIEIARREIDLTDFRKEKLICGFL